MQIARQGDQVLVHYVKRAANGATATSRGGSPLELVVGAEHPRLPGLKLTLAGMEVGNRVSLFIPVDQAHGPVDPRRIHRLSRARFPADAVLLAGRWVRIANARGRRRAVRIVTVGKRTVVVDANHRWAGQSLQLEIELVAIRGPSDPTAVTAPPHELTVRAPAPQASSPAPIALIGTGLLPEQGRAVAFDLDAASVASVQRAFPSWVIETINRPAAADLIDNWDLGSADLLILGIQENAAETIQFCRLLSHRLQPRGEAAVSGEHAVAARHRPVPGGGAKVPLLVLVKPGQETLVRAALEAGAHCCLVLPIYAAQLSAMMAHVFDENQPGRHTLTLNHPQESDRLRDDGGEA